MRKWIQTKNANPYGDAHAMAFVNMARKYPAAADELFTLSERRPQVGRQSAFGDPLYLLYSHAAELALKAYLRSFDLPILGARQHHNLLALYEECRDLGLKIHAGDQFDIRNVLDLLESANEFQGLRYSI